MNETRAIEINDLWFSYNGQPALKDVSFTVSKGVTACLVGPNGGGKTTLLKLITGLLVPDRGSIRIFGQGPEKARGKIGYAPQYGVFDPRFPATVADVVMMGCIGCGRSRKDNQRRVFDSLHEVGVANLINKPYAALSGGQRQRVLIARAIVSSPELLLLDEPTAGMDAAAEAEFHDLLDVLHSRLTLVMVSHDLGFVSDLVDSVICVKETVMVHPTAELTGEVMREIYGRDVRLIRHDHDCTTDHHHGHGGGK